MAQREVDDPCCSSNESEHAKVASHHIHADDEEDSEGRSCCSKGKLLMCDKCKEIGRSLTICTSKSLEDRDNYEFCSCNEYKTTLVAIANEGSSKEEERFPMCSSIG